MAPSPDDPSARVLAAHAGFEIVEVDRHVWFFDRRTRGPSIAAAVSGGVGAITSINALLLGLSLLTGSDLGASWPAVVIITVLAAIGFGICRGALELRQRRASCPRATLRPLAWLDRRRGSLFDADGRELAPVGAVRAARAIQIGSSAPALALRLPNGRRIDVYQGSLFGSDIDRGLAALAELGFATGSGAGSGS
jgi:hypothetical protein